MKKLDEEIEILENSYADNDLTLQFALNSSSDKESSDGDHTSTELMTKSEERESSNESIFKAELKEAVESFTKGDLEKSNELLENFTYEFESFIEQPIFKYFAENKTLKSEILSNSSVENSYLMLAMSYIELELFKKAKWKISKGLTFYPNNLTLQNLLAKCHIMLKEPEAAREILERGMFLGNIDSIDIFESLWKPNFSFEYFIDVVMNGDLEKVKNFIENGMDINLQNSEGRTALIYASFLGMKKIVTLLLENGALLEISDKKGKTAFVHAVERKDIEIMKLLLSRGANIAFENITVKEKIKEFVDEGSVEALSLFFGHNYIEKAENEFNIHSSSDEDECEERDLNDEQLASEEDLISSVEVDQFEEREEDDWEESLKQILGEESSKLEEYDEETIFSMNTLHRESNTEENRAEYVNSSVFSALVEKSNPELELRQKEMLGAIDLLISKKQYVNPHLTTKSVTKKSLFSSLFGKKIKINNFLEFLATKSHKEIVKLIESNMINMKDKAGNTVLLSAIQLEDTEILEKIFYQMPDIKVRNRAGQGVEDLILQVRVQNRSKIEKLYERYLESIGALKEEKVETVKESKKEMRERLKREKKELAQRIKESKTDERKARRKNSK